MRSRRVLQLPLAAVVLAAAAVAAAQPPAPAAPAGAKALFEAHCAVCHGVDGRADTPVSSHLVPRPRDLADPVEMARVTEDRIYHAIKEGRPGTAMAPWASVLTEIQIGDLIDYIRGLRRPLPPDFSPERLSLEVGRRLYGKNCAMCHGTDGSAATEAARVLRPRPTNFFDPITMARLDDGRLYAAIKLGRPGTAMGGWGDLLSPLEMIDVMRYVRSLTLALPAGMTRAGLDVLVGERIYREHCALCHGERGDGRAPVSRSLRPRPRDFTDAEGMAGVTDARMIRTILHGSPGTAMAPWGGILNGEDARRVVRYIRQTFQGQP